MRSPTQWLLAALAAVMLVAVLPRNGMAEAREQETTAGRIGASAVWRPPANFLTHAHAICDKLAGPASFPVCFMNQMPAAGAPADAVSFSRMLFRETGGQLGIMVAFQHYGVVDAAQVFYPLRANDNYGVLLVNGDPEILDIDNLEKLDRAALQADPKFQAIKRKFSQVDVWPGDRSARAPWPEVRPLPGGGTEFIVSYPLLNGCHACERVGVARFGWEFDASGKFLRASYLPASAKS